MAENIFLIGFMGAGKSTIAKVLKEKLNVPLCEMDEMIAEQQKMAISDIFAQYGETYFRDLETQLVKDISEKDGVIVSCGGGQDVCVDRVFYHMTVAQADIPAAILRNLRIMRYEDDGASFRMKLLKEDKYLK